MIIYSLECIFMINYLSPFMFSAEPFVFQCILFFSDLFFCFLLTICFVFVNEISKHIYVIGRGFLLIATDKKDYILCCDNQRIGSSKHTYTCYYAQSIKNEISRVSVLSQSLTTVSLSCWLWICRFWHAEEWLPRSLAWEHQSRLVVLMNLY